MSELEQIIKEIESYTNPHCMVPKHQLKDWVKSLTKIKDEINPPTPKIKIKPNPVTGEYKSGSISSKYSKEDINKILGFEPNVEDDPDKVVNAWGFKANGKHCAIWDYCGVKWSTCGPEAIFKQLFPD